MAARKTCETCGTNYAKSAYYDHLPCQKKSHSESGKCIGHHRDVFFHYRMT